jgi:hypothetical protein
VEVGSWCRVRCDAQMTTSGAREANGAGAGGLQRSEVEERSRRGECEESSD